MSDKDSNFYSWHHEGEDEIWDEQKWEEELKKNEQLMDKHKEVLEEDPERDWDDPLDLYYKVHYDIDIDEIDDLSEHEDDTEEDNTDVEDLNGNNFLLASDQFLAEAEDLENQLNDIESYRLAREFATKIREYVRRTFGLSGTEDSNVKILLLESVKIGTNIAGGHGLGYDKKTLCGNIVKCKWALESAKLCMQMLDELIINRGVNEAAMELISLVQSLKQSIEFRIDALRRSVWWM